MAVSQCRRRRLSCGTAAIMRRMALRQNAKCKIDGVRYDRRAGACLPPHWYEAKHPTYCHPERRRARSFPSVEDDTFGVRAPQSNGSHQCGEVRRWFHSFVPGETPTQASPLRGSAALRVTAGWGCFFAPILLGRFYVKGVAARLQEQQAPLPFRLNGRGAAFAGSLLPLPCGVTRHPKTVINRFEMAPPLGKAFEEGTSVGSRSSTLKALPRRRVRRADEGWGNNCRDRRPRRIALASGPQPFCKNYNAKPQFTVIRAVWRGGPSRTPVPTVVIGEDAVRAVLR